MSLSYLTADFMADARRDQAFQAIADSLHNQAAAIKHREESFIARNGGGWDTDAAQDYAALEAAAIHFDHLYAGARDVALEVANANKKGGVERHYMPAWITRLGDVLISSFLRSLPNHGKGGSDVRVDAVA